MKKTPTAYSENQSLQLLTDPLCALLETKLVRGLANLNKLMPVNGLS